jgi:phosphoribosylaminoimidazole carboxylase
MNRVIGLLGGGQLGQMLCEAANPLGIKVVVLDAEKSPAKKVNANNAHIDGSFTDPEKIRQLARQVDILTVEIEHVDTGVLEEIAERGVSVVEDGKETIKRIEVQPSWKTLRMIQDKYFQKVHLSEYGIPVALSNVVEGHDLESIGQRLGYPFMLKARKDAYDGRGNFPVMSKADIPEALQALKGRALYAEKWANFKMELAVMVVKTENATSAHAENTIAYPTVETVHEDSICKLVYAPARKVTEKIRKQAQELARRAVGCLWGKGVFGVEMFLMEDSRFSIILVDFSSPPRTFTLLVALTNPYVCIDPCPTIIGPPTTSCHLCDFLFH